MGCGESKHDVVAGNTISHHKKSDTNTKSSKDIETVRETNAKDNIADLSMPQQLAAKNEDKEVVGGAVAAAHKTEDRGENAAKNEGNKEVVGGAIAVTRDIEERDENMTKIKDNKEVVGGAVAAAHDTKDRDENTAKIKDNKEVIDGAVVAARDTKDRDENTAKIKDNKEVVGGAVAASRDTENIDEKAAKIKDNKEVVGGAVEAAHETEDRGENAAKNEDNKEVVDGAVAATRDTEERDESVAANEGDGDKQIDKGKEGGDVKKQEQSGGRLISNDSLNDYFTPRKNEEGIDGIVSDEKSEEPVYYSPHHATGKEDVLNENGKADNAVEEKELVEETKVVKENGL
jgi:hypothetical protein